MTRILFHPANALGAQGDAVILPLPWRWWQTRVYENRQYGALLEQRIEPNIDDPREFLITFGPDWDRVVLTDPPACVIEIEEDWSDWLWGDPLRTVRPISQTATVEVVWHEPPGERWCEVPRMLAACRPGEYRIDTRCQRESELRPHRLTPGGWDRYIDPTRILRWPIIPTVRDGIQMPLNVQQTLPLHAVDRCGQCQRFMMTAEIGRSLLRLPGGLCDECHGMRQTGLLTLNEIRRREGLPPIDSGTLMRAAIAPMWPSGVPPQIADHIPETHLFGNREVLKPEQKVLDDIEALVNEQLQQTPSGYERLVNQEYCELCGGLWHGLTGEGGTDQMGNKLGRRGCPGAFATDDEIEQWQAKNTH